MIIMVENDFDKEIKYKLFRTVTEILHPSISKKNISDYKIIIGEDYLPVRIYYPKKISEMNQIMIYIHGNGKVTDCIGKYSSICKNLCLKTDSLLIAIEYEEEKSNYKDRIQKIYETVKYLYHGLEMNDIDLDHICLVGDSTGCNMITAIHYLNKKEIPIHKEILFYPTLSLEYFGKSKYESMEKNKNFNPGLLESLESYFLEVSNKEELKEEMMNPLKWENQEVPDTLIMVGNVDLLKDEAKEYFEKMNQESSKYVELPFCAHGFLKTDDKELENEIYSEVRSFLG